MMESLQKLGKALMGAVTVMPVAALLMGIGYWIDPTGWGANNLLAAVLIKSGGTGHHGPTVPGSSGLGFPRLGCCWPQERPVRHRGGPAGRVVLQQVPSHQVARFPGVLLRPSSSPDYGIGSFDRFGSGAVLRLVTSLQLALQLR